MYTLIDLEEIQYEIGIRAEEYERVDDIENFIQEVALGIVDIKELIVDNSISKEIVYEIGQIAEEVTIVNIEERTSKKEALVNEESESKKEDLVNDESESKKEDLVPEESESHKEDLVQGVEPKEDLVQRVEQQEDLVTQEDLDLEEDVVQRVEPQEELVLKKEQQTDKDTVIKEESRSKNKIDNSKNSDNKEEQKTGLFGRLFRSGRNNKFKQVDIDLDGDVMTTLREDYTRGKYFKEMIIQEGYLSIEEVGYVEQVIEKNKTLGHTKFFIQVCREKKLLSEDVCAMLLSKGTTTEVVSKDILDTQAERLGKYNNKLYLNTDKYFIIDVDNAKEEVTICKDLSNNPNMYYIEKLHPGYSVFTKNVVEGVTKEIHEMISLQNAR